MRVLKALHVVAAKDIRIQEAKDQQKPVLDLSGLSLRGIPASAWCGALAKYLTCLDLCHNQLTELPPCIGQLSLLQTLRVSQNGLGHLPDQLELLQQLVCIDCSRNQLTDIPLCLDSLKHLEQVNFSGNRITRLRASSFSLPRLRQFYVTRNPVVNVPQSVYIDGLLAIRRYFDIHVEVPQQVCGDVQKQYSSICEEISHLKLRPVVTEKPLVNCESVENLHIERTSAFRLVRKDVAAHKQLQRLESDGHFSTSDYGSCTGSQLGSGTHDRRDDDDPDSCCGDQGSDAGDVRHEISDVCEDVCEHCHQPLAPEIDFEDDDCVDIMLPNRTRFLKAGHAAVLIPEHNKSHILRAQFFLELLEDRMFFPEMEKDMIHASVVANIGPCGAQFYEDSPAVIRLPLFTEIGVARVRCFTSETDDAESPFWMEIPSCDFKVFKGYVLIKATHLSLFTVMLDKAAPTVTKRISSEEGGKLVVDQVPGVEVLFPQGSLSEDITASVKVICDELSSDLRTNIAAEDTCASPTVILQPHGYFFKVQRDCKVIVQLPIPNYNRIVQHFGGEAKLSVWHSPTSEDEPVAWEQLDVTYFLQSDDDGNHSLVIPVEHFSWLTALWNGIRTRLNNTGMSLGFYSGGAISMKCQAWMLESPDTEKFGLVVICHHSDDSSMQDVGNYAKNVGGSLKPVSISPGGDIVVRLARSDYFEADTAAGEDASLEKVEAHYNGGEFEMQFACRFKGTNKPKEREIFGKVFVRKRQDDGSEERLFEFNLIKKSDEDEDGPEDPWTAASLKELADMHGITMGDNWKQFARELGFSLQMIRTKFSRASDPFAEIVLMFRRQGGEYEEFMRTLYTVVRKQRLNDDTLGEGTSTMNAGGGDSGVSWGLRQMFSLGGLLRGSKSSPSHSGSSTPRSVNEDEESQPGPSGLQSGSRKRSCPTCEPEPTPATPTRSGKRLRLSPSTSESSGASEDPVTVWPHPSTPNRTPPHTPGAGTFCSLPTTSRYSPPHISHVNRGGHLVNTTLVHSHSMPGMSGLSSVYGPNSSHMATGSGLLYNPPLTAAHYGSIPNTAQQTMPNPPNDQDNLQRANPQEIGQNQLYHIASLIQSNWVKVARFIRDDETLETDIKSIKETNPSPEEQATQMLLQWREKCPDRCTRGVLYGALCDLNLKSVAIKCEKIYKKTR